VLTCQQLSERATDYLENALTARQRAGIQVHLLMCKHCRSYIDQLAKTVQLLKAAGQAVAPETPDPALLARFRTGPSEPQG
jgi:predicted anti-sigma-YlaC factor YlaD